MSFRQRRMDNKKLDIEFPNQEEFEEESEEDDGEIPLEVNSSPII